MQVGKDSPAANRLGDTVASVIEDIAVEQARVRSFREKIYREPQFIAKEKVQMNADEWVKMMADPGNNDDEVKKWHLATLHLYCTLIGQLQF